MEVAQEIAITATRSGMEARMAAGIPIELSKRAQHKPWKPELLRTYNTAMDRSEICNCAARGL